MNNFFNLKKYENETDFEFCLRCCLAKHHKEIEKILLGNWVLEQLRNTMRIKLQRC